MLTDETARALRAMRKELRQLKAPEAHGLTREQVWALMDSFDARLERAESAWKVMCERAARLERPRRARGSHEEPEYRLPAQPDELDLLLAAGWGDVDRPKIPADVLEDAKAGKFPRRKG